MSEQVICCKCGTPIAGEPYLLATSVGEEPLCAACKPLEPQPAAKQPKPKAKRLRVETPLQSIVGVEWWSCRVLSARRITVPPPIQQLLKVREGDYLQVRFKLPEEAKP